MPPQFDLDQFYFLLTAFDRVGRHVFEDHWTGYEAWARPSIKPEELRAQKETLLAELDDLGLLRQQKSRRFHNQPRDSAAQVTLGNEIAKLDRNRTSLEKELRDLPTETASDSYDHQKWQRRAHCERLIRDAIDDNTLDLLTGTGTGGLWVQYRGEPETSLSVELSQLTFPEIDGLKRVPAWFERKAFDSWLTTILPDKPEAEMTPEQRCRLWLQVQFNTGDLLKKELVCEDAMNMFGISRRGFNQLWAELAPAAFKKPGRKRVNQNA